MDVRRARTNGAPSWSMVYPTSIEATDCLHTDLLVDKEKQELLMHTVLLHHHLVILLPPLRLVSPCSPSVATEWRASVAGP